MTYIPTTYTEADASLQELTTEVASVMSSVRTAIARIQAGSDKMDVIAQAAPSGYLSLISFINAQAGANPSDPAWTAMKNKSDKIVADFISINAYIDNLLTAINAV